MRIWSGGDYGWIYKLLHTTRLKKPINQILKSQPQPMKKSLLILIIPILLPLASFFQIGNEIRSYVDSTELLVQNGKWMILKELNNGNLVKTKEIYTCLSKETENEMYSAFYFIEDLYINMLVADWKIWGQFVLNYSKY